MKRTNKFILCASSLFLLNVSAICADTASTTEDENVLKITLPKVPEAPKAIVLDVVEPNGKEAPEVTVQELLPKKEEVTFSDHVAPHPFKYEKFVVNEFSGLGSVNKGRVAAYLHGSYMKAEDVEANLKKAGFSVLAKYELDKKGTITSIVFTDKEMEQNAAKTNRGFASTLRILVDKEENLLVIPNPIYVMKAFMQEEYDQKVAEDTLTKLRDSFSDLKESEEVLKFRVLERYQFMENMPYYQDMEVIATESNDALLKKAMASKDVVYEQHLSNGSIILGVELDRRTKKFVKKIGYKNAGLLPYPVLIEDGKAKILDPKYYIAVMYPMLKMSEFMTIATIPGAISKDIDKIFR